MSVDKPPQPNELQAHPLWDVIAIDVVHVCSPFASSLGSQDLFIGRIQSHLHKVNNTAATLGEVVEGKMVPEHFPAHFSLIDWNSAGIEITESLDG